MLLQSHTDSIVQRLLVSVLLSCFHMQSITNPAVARCYWLTALTTTMAACILLLSLEHYQLDCDVFLAPNLDSLRQWSCVAFGVSMTQQSSLVKMTNQ